MLPKVIQLSTRWLPAVLLSAMGLATPRMSYAQLISRQPGFPALSSLSSDSARLIKRRYSVRRPVPNRLLRALSTDRPDVTESAYSVDAGHFQLETDLIRVVHQSVGPWSEREIDINNINLKLGVSRTTDIELVINSYAIRFREEPQPVHLEGIGDLTLRMKRNLWGNDGGKTALSLIPFVKIPTGRRVGNHAWEGGLVAPFAWQLPRDWTFGSQLQTTLNRDVEASAYYIQLAPTVTVGHNIYRTLGGFIEVAGYWDVRQPDWRVTLNGGPILRIRDTLQLDLGVNLALTPDTPSSYFLGLSFRH